MGRSVVGKRAVTEMILGLVNYLAFFGLFVSILIDILTNDLFVV